MELDVRVIVHLVGGNACEFFYPTDMFEQKSKEYVDFFQEGNTQGLLVFQTMKTVTILPRERIIYIEVVKR